MRLEESGLKGWENNSAYTNNKIISFASNLIVPVTFPRRTTSMQNSVSSVPDSPLLNSRSPQLKNLINSFVAPPFRSVYSTFKIHSPSLFSLLHDSETFRNNTVRLIGRLTHTKMRARRISLRIATSILCKARLGKGNFV